MNGWCLLDYGLKTYFLTNKNLKRRKDDTSIVHIFKTCLSDNGDA